MKINKKNLNELPFKYLNFYAKNLLKYLLLIKIKIVSHEAMKKFLNQHKQKEKFSLYRVFFGFGGRG